MMPIVCTMERCYKKGEAHMVVKLTGVLLLNIASTRRRSQPGLGSGVPIQEGAQTKTEHSWLCEEEGYSIKAVSIVHKECDTCNSPTTKNVKTKVLCHCISSLGHSLVYRKCSMGHYAMRVTSLCKGFYKDHQPDQVSGMSRQEAVQSSLGKYHCLSLTKDVPGQAVCEVLISLTGVLKMIWSCPSFSKMAVKSVERGRLQTGSMK
ncbi:hypothetical protein IGI04_042800, partial [Brassica rapa subsp. trilocularis]